jgi:hypothetical protein
MVDNLERQVNGQMVELVDTAFLGITVNQTCFCIYVGATPTLGHNKKNDKIRIY